MICLSGLYKLTCCRDLLEAVRKWEENELSGAKVSLNCSNVKATKKIIQVEKPLIEKKKLAPLNDGGPTQLLNLQIQKLEQENQSLRQRMKTVVKISDLNLLIQTSLLLG